MATRRLKSDIFAGVLVLAPLGVTLWVFLALVNFADGLIRLLPLWAQPQTWLGVPLPGLGIVVTLAFVGVVGFAMRYYTGRRVVELYERALTRVPILSGIYHGFKQLIETLFSQQGQHFRQVVLIEYPRRGIHCIAFVTNEHSFLASGAGGEELASVFLPTTPNPTSGFYLLVPRSDIQQLDITVEEAFKLIMSAGIVLPPGARTAHPLYPPERPRVVAAGG